MKKISVLVCLSLMLFSLTFVCLAEKTYDLSFNLQEGSNYDINLEATTTINQEIMGQSMEMGQSITASYTYNIKERTDQDIYKIDMEMGNMSFDFTKFDLTDAEEEIDLESLNEEMSYLNDMMTDVDIEMEMDKYGKVISMNGLEEYINNMYEYAIENSEDPETVTAYQNMASQFNDQVMMESMSQYSVFMPGKKVSVGETWTQEMKLQQDFPFVLSVDYTLDSVTADEFVLSFNGSISDIGDFASMLGLGDMDVDMDMDIDTEYTGVVHLDRETCWYKKMEVLMSMDGSISMTVPVDEEGTMQEFNIPMSSTSEMLITSN
ncbi:MAG: DUF6263 family protein [Halanaerobiales bacterium]